MDRIAMFKRLQHAIALLSLVLSGLALAGDKQTDYPDGGEYCVSSDLISGSCERGDYLIISGHASVKFCDFGDPVISFPHKDGGLVICTFTGKERIRDKRAITTQDFQNKEAERQRKEAIRLRILERANQQAN